MGKRKSDAQPSSSDSKPKSHKRQKQRKKPDGSKGKAGTSKSSKDMIFDDPSVLKLDISKHKKLTKAALKKLFQRDGEDHAFRIDIAFDQINFPLADAVKPVAYGAKVKKQELEKQRDQKSKEGKAGVVKMEEQTSGEDTGKEGDTKKNPTPSNTGADGEGDSKKQPQDGKVKEIDNDDEAKNGGGVETMVHVKDWGWIEMQQLTYVALQASCQASYLSQCKLAKAAPVRVPNGIRENFPKEPEKTDQVMKTPKLTNRVKEGATISWNAFQKMHTGRQVSPAEWRAYKEKHRRQQEQIEAAAAAEAAAKAAKEAADSAANMNPSEMMKQNDTDFKPNPLLASISWNQFQRMNKDRQVTVEEWRLFKRRHQMTRHHFPSSQQHHRSFQMRHLKSSGAGTPFSSPQSSPKHHPGINPPYTSGFAPLPSFGAHQGLMASPSGAGPSAVAAATLSEDSPVGPAPGPTPPGGRASSVGGRMPMIQMNEYELLHQDPHVAKSPADVISQLEKLKKMFRLLARRPQLFSTMKSDGTSSGPEPIDREEYIDSQRLLHARHQLSDVARIVEAVYKLYSESKRSLLESSKKKSANSSSSSSNSAAGNSGANNASSSAAKSGAQQKQQHQQPLKGNTSSGGDVKEDGKKSEETQPKAAPTTTTAQKTAAPSPTGEEASGVEEPTKKKKKKKKKKTTNSKASTM
mmetsp:Transcript_15590/g.25419  ORF Transcript_15590/g.25419 Transcript_15590/m.25419 type:complete len:692 (+) Transcript_15590:178-2253(+)